MAPKSKKSSKAVHEEPPAPEQKRVKKKGVMKIKVPSSIAKKRAGHGTSRPEKSRKNISLRTRLHNRSRKNWKEMGRYLIRDVVLHAHEYFKVLEAIAVDKLNGMPHGARAALLNTTYEEVHAEALSIRLTPTGLNQPTDMLPNLKFYPRAETKGMRHIRHKRLRSAKEDDDEDVDPSGSDTDNDSAGDNDAESCGSGESSPSVSGAEEEEEEEE